MPLGETVTRSGLRARVICNDAYGISPVIAEVQTSLGSRNMILRRYKRDGTSGLDSRLDLVGFEYHEIKTPKDTELEDLRRWKAEAMQVLAELNAQEIGKEMGLTIGQAVTPRILPYIRSLKAKLETAKGGLTQVERNEAAALLDAVKHCWSQLPADLAFNDLLMRRTAPRDWTPENLKLAKRANHYVNEL